MKQIFSLGSCRLFLLLDKCNFNYNHSVNGKNNNNYITYSHSTKDILTILNLMFENIKLKDLNLNISKLKCLFSIGGKRKKLNEKDIYNISVIENKFFRLKEEFINSKYVFFEISSIKYVLSGGIYYHHNWAIINEEEKIMDYKLLISDLDKIIGMCNGKKIIFVSHFNYKYSIKNRQFIINTIKDYINYKKNKNIFLYDPSKIVNENLNNITSDSNHYKKENIDLVVNDFKIFLKKL